MPYGDESWHDNRVWCVALAHSMCKIRKRFNWALQNNTTVYNCSLGNEKLLSKSYQDSEARGLVFSQSWYRFGRILSGLVEISQFRKQTGQQEKEWCQNVNLPCSLGCQRQHSIEWLPLLQNKRDTFKENHEERAWFVKTRGKLKSYTKKDVHYKACWFGMRRCTLLSPTLRVRLAR